MPAANACALVGQSASALTWPLICRVGSWQARHICPLELSLTDAVADTAVIMAAISALLPEESRVRHEPTAEELARTKPPS